MELSLELLKVISEKKATVRLVEGQADRRYRGIQFLGPSTIPQEGMLYACEHNAERLPSWQVHAFEHSGLIVAGEKAFALDGVPALIFPDTDLYEAFNLISEAFLFFNDWQERVYRKALEHPRLDAFMGLLDEVTPNPWYIADGSYRVLAARDAPEVEDLSYIWRFLYRNRRLPLDTVLAMEDMGKIEQMSRHKTAYIPTVEPFNIPFVSKAIDTPGGAVAHFYIIGVYTRLSQYEIEIADFFGDVLMQMLARGGSKLQAMGRFYDSFISRLIGGETPEDALAVLQKMYSDLSWAPSDQLQFVVFGDSGTPESVTDRQRVLAVESRCRSRGFFHGGHASAIINVTQLEQSRRGETDAVALLLRSFARDFRCNIGASEGFSGFQNFMCLEKWFNQALFCLEEADKKHSGEIAAKTSKALRDYAPSRVSSGLTALGAPSPCVVAFPSVAIRYFQSKIAAVDGMKTFLHPALEVLRDYDERNHATLLETLTVYLENDRSVTRTAELLFVHRNTLLKRMNKIATLTSIDLDDAECRKRLLLSLQIMRRREL